MWRTPALAGFPNTYQPAAGVLSSRVRPMRSIIIFLATGAYTGYAPVASGTAGAALGMVLGWLVFAPLWRHSPAAFLMIFMVLFIGACFVAGSAEKIFEDHDSSHIVIDEVLGMIATMFLNPTSFLWVMTGFVVFRLFDIIKPFPASFFDRRVGGAGVMLDDLAAGIYANLVVRVARMIV